MSQIERSPETQVNRRMALGAFAAGAGALLFGSAGSAQAEETSEGGHTVAWEDGWDYPLVGVDEGGQWVIAGDDGEYLVDPTGWVFDDGTWYPISAVGNDGIWYLCNDGYEYLLDGFDGSTETLV
jgi:hypothetical protein